MDTVEFRPQTSRKESPELLTATAAAQLLGMSRTTFYTLLPRLRAKGLRVVSQPSILDGAPPSKRYTRTSIMRVIEHAAMREESIC